MASPHQAPPAGDGAMELQAARQGSPEALGQLLQGHRQYLLLVANQELTAEMRAKVAASDLVQETFLQAHREFDQFRGQSQAEFQAWLRRILLNHLADATRDLCATDKRELGREVHLSQDQLENELLDPASSPSSLVAAAEEAEKLRRALEQLPADYREVIQLRNYDRLSFEEIGRRMQRSAEAVRKLWVRALDQLGKKR